MEEKKESFFEKNKVALGIAVAGLIALGGFIAFKAGSSNPAPKKDQGQSVKSSGVENSGVSQGSKTSGASNAAYDAKVNLLRGKIANETQKGELEMNTILLMHEALIDIAYEGFGELVTNNRAERRKVLGKDDAAYENFVIKGAEEIEKLISAKMKQVTEDCGCSMALYERSCQNWATKNPQFAMLSILIIEKMKIKIPSANKGEITLENAKDMMKFQIQEFPRIDIKVKNMQVYPLVKQSWLGDIVAEKFGFEEEDMAKIKGLELDPEIRQLAQQLQTLIQMDAISVMGRQGM